MPIGINSLVQYKAVSQNIIANSGNSMRNITPLDTDKNNNCCCIEICSCKHGCYEPPTLGIDIKRSVGKREKGNISNVFIASPTCPNPLNSFQAVSLADYEFIFTTLSLLSHRDICSKALFHKNNTSEDHFVLLFRPPEKNIRIS